MDPAVGCDVDSGLSEHSRLEVMAVGNDRPSTARKACWNVRCGCSMPPLSVRRDRKAEAKCTPVARSDRSWCRNAMVAVLIVCGASYEWIIDAVNDSRQRLASCLCIPEAVM